MVHVFAWCTTEHAHHVASLHKPSPLAHKPKEAATLLVWAPNVAAKVDANHHAAWSVGGGGTRESPVFLATRSMAF